MSKFPPIFILNTFFLFSSFLSFAQTPDEIVDTRLSSLVDYQNDTTNLNALWTFAQSSEYLADYDLAANAYGIIIRKLQKTQNKQQLSKATAHQITCRFLLQSQKVTTPPLDKEPKENSNSIYGIGISQSIISNHLLVKNVIPGKPAALAGLKNCDEIISINGVAHSDDYLNSRVISGKLRGDKDSYVDISVRRLGVKGLIDFKIKRAFVDIAANQQQNINSSETNNVATSSEPLNNNQLQKQSFLKKMVTALQKDTVLMKRIETAKKITYALTILNKWSNEPVSNKYFVQIDEQLGMVSSLIVIIKGLKPNFNFDNDGKVSFGDPKLKQLVSTDYSKQAQSRFDSVAHTQPVKETKIDDNITFVEKKHSLLISAYYMCISSDKPNSCPESESWIQTPGGDACIGERKNSFIKLYTRDQKIFYEQTMESRTAPCTTSSPGFTLYSGGNYSKTNIYGEGVFQINKAFQMNFKIESFVRIEPGKEVLELFGKKDVTYHKLTESTTTNDNSAEWELEILSDSKVKITTKYGSTIYQKVKGL